MAAGDSVYDEGKMQIRIDLLGSLYGPSIEDYEQCMGLVMDKILENKKVRSIVLAKDREYEYDYEQVKMLLEVADLIGELIREKFISRKNLGSEECSRCYPDRSSKLQYIIVDLLRKDPIGAYVEVLREIRNMKMRLKKTASSKCYECYMHYKENVLDRLGEKMENLQIIQQSKSHISGYHIGDRTLYRQLFMPVVRPNFMLTRYMLVPPEGGKSVDRYKIGDTQVEIFKLPHAAHYF